MMLVPILKPGDIVIMDNLPAHKVAGVRETIEAAARTVDTLEAAIASALKTFQPHECANFFAHAGYGSD
jgi:hypothetical protein